VSDDPQIVDVVQLLKNEVRRHMKASTNQHRVIKQLTKERDEALREVERLNGVIANALT